MTTYLITTGGTLELQGADGRYEWCSEEGERMGVDARSYEASIKAGLAAWPDGAIVVLRDGFNADEVIGAVEGAL